MLEAWLFLRGILIVGFIVLVLGFTIKVCEFIKPALEKKP